MPTRGPLGGWVGGMIEGLVDLVLPATCAGCDEPSVRALCEPCRVALAEARPQRTRPDPEPAGLPPTYALAAYAGALRRAIVQYKEENRHELTGALGELLARVAARAVPAGPVVLVPVPATAAAIRRRHGDHMLRLVRGTARVLPGAAIARPLRALPKAEDSAQLSAVERTRAARHAFAVHRGRIATLREHLRRSGAAVVLVDDIVTTGVTLAAAGGALAEAGIAVHRTAVLAATQRRRGPSASGVV
ncbi:ComF family protein [Dactylosporangium sp. CA-139066]|uniref:ComF family protein n=1 Tax=Dactylosporangium sp. CA-139066 TaxID=3239930 RepID=UPI003D9160AF